MPKTCIRCKTSKPIGEFWKDVRSSDGLHVYCKECKKQLASIYRKTPKGRRACCESQKRHNEKHPDRSKARRAVERAVKSGRLLHISHHRCIECGKQAKQYHHFAGYDAANKLNVIPMCKECHHTVDSDDGTYISSSRNYTN